MKKILLLAGAILAMACSRGIPVETVDRFPEGINAHYPSVSAPLLPQQLIKGPRGEFAALELASPVWRLYGLPGLVAHGFPKAENGDGKKSPTGCAAMRRPA